MLKSAGTKDAVKATVAKLIKKFNELGVMSFTRGPGSILRTQQPGESAEQFIIALYTLSEWCEYRDMREQLIRDRLVVGILDSTLSSYSWTPTWIWRRPRKRYVLRRQFKKANMC